MLSKGLYYVHTTHYRRMVHTISFIHPLQNPSINEIQPSTRKVVVYSCLFPKSRFFETRFFGLFSMSLESSKNGGLSGI